MKKKVEYLSLAYGNKIMQNIGDGSSAKTFLKRGLCTSILWSMASVMSLVVKSDLAGSRKYRLKI